ncbi:MAG: efflux RND transporter periplasmic adaptor subunit [Aureliella sp.]
MATVGMSSGMANAFATTFATGVSGVASLDTPQLNQTKAEIRSLVAEIAELSAAGVDSDQFLPGMLSRVCMAMGASAAAVWQIDRDQSLELLAGHNLPAEIAQADTESADAHRRVLACVAAEGHPVLVPPGSVRIEADRPSNPLDEALLIVPVRIHERVDTLLEVIQSSGGGPAAQRGYLRFVAQMADLMADFLRRARLGELAREAEHVRQLQEQLLTISAASSPKERSQAVACGLARLTGAELALLVAKTRRDWRVQAINDLASFDPRSETVRTAEGLIRRIDRSARGVPKSATILAQSSDPIASTDDLGDGTAEGLRSLLGCERLAVLPLSEDGQCQALLALDRTLDDEQLLVKLGQLQRPLGALLAPQRDARGRALAQPRGWLAGAPARTKTLASRIERWIVRGSTVGLVAAIALFPTPDQVSVVAVLEAANKQLYYAPASAAVDRVLVDSNQHVKAGDVLAKLVDKQLEARLDELTGERTATAAQLDQDRSALLRGQHLTAGQRDELESRIEQLKITIRSLDDQLTILRARAEGLSIVARNDAVVTTWDARNRLEGRPVAAGQLLLATCSPEAAWQLQLSIPERQAGMVEDALAAAGDQGLSVQFSLSSHPGEVRSGRLVSLSKQLLKDARGGSKVLGTVLVDPSTLPAKTDGAVARAAIDCGKVAAVWLVVRDAYRAASAWVRMTW